MDVSTAVCTVSGQRLKAEKTTPPPPPPPHPSVKERTTQHSWPHSLAERCLGADMACNSSRGYLSALTMNRWSLVVLTLMGMLLLLLSVCVESVDTDGGQAKSETESKSTEPTTCEDKYLHQNPSHTRCLRDNVNARILFGPRKRWITYYRYYHNRVRSNVCPGATNMMRVMWDKTLSGTAMKWALQCNPHHDHMSNRQEPDFPGVRIGQTIVVGVMRIRRAINRMYSEKFHANCADGDGFVEGAQRYFQMVSHATIRVGCAAVMCPHTHFRVIHVCNYAPAMNISQPPYTSGVSCGDCLGHCVGGTLCHCGNKLCFNGGELDPRNCQCRCQTGWTGATCAEADTCTAEYASLTPRHTRCLRDDPQAVLVPLTEDTQSHILELHNSYRRRVDPPAANMMKMVWDDNLAVTARKWALQCVMEHEANMKSRSEPDWPGLKIAQNLGSGHSSFNSTLQRYFSEKEHTGYVHGGEVKKGMGHYFQLVSYDSVRVGCAEAKCPHTEFKVIRVCNYAPALNAAKAPYQNGTSCQACNATCDESGKLCDCKGKICYNSGEVDPSTCQCKCRPRWTGENCEILDCSKRDLMPSCRYGALKKDDCGKPGTLVHDPKMCPHLCGLCPKPCGGLECQNGGILNWDTCKCSCRGRLTGATCESCPSTDAKDCSVFRMKKGGRCQVPNTLDCPIHCELCHTTCKPCQHLGDLNTTDCTCSCRGRFSGDLCEICPKEDEDFCSLVGADLCHQEPRIFASVQTSCPYKCSVCRL